MDQKKLEWAQVKEFVDGQFSVVVKKLPLRPMPRFSIEILNTISGRDGFAKQVKFFNLNTQGQGKVTVDSIAQRIGILISKAEMYVQEEAQKIEDENLAYRIEREQRAMNFGKTEARHTGKTAREKAKKRHAQGQA